MNEGVEILAASTHVVAFKPLEDRYPDPDLFFVNYTHTHTQLCSTKAAQGPQLNVIQGF